ncbi:MAG TPA: hypothetical protein VF530_14185 [Planctomycetota bacterium]
MRAGPLSDDRVLDRLERDFVCTWILHDDLVRLGEGSGPWAPIAKDVAEAYAYPVDSLVLSCEGEILAHVAANDDPSIEGYLRLLDAAGK